MALSVRSRWSPPVVVGTAILVVSLLPVSAGGTATPVVPFGIDAWLHLAGYAVLSAGLARALSMGGQSGLTGVGVAVLLAAGFGIGVELLQTTVPARRFELTDLAANAVGSIVGAAGWWTSGR